MNDIETMKALYANAGATAGGKLMRFPADAAARHNASLKQKPIGPKAVAAAVMGSQAPQLLKADLPTLMRESEALIEAMTGPRK